MSNALKSCGSAYFQRRISQGVYMPMFKLGNTTQFEITETTETDTLKSRDCSNYGTAIATSTSKNPATLKMRVDDMTKTAYELGFLADVEDITVPSVVVTNEVLGTSNPEEGCYFVLNNRGVDGVVITSNDGTVTYVEGTDYRVLNPKAGIIQVIGTAIPDANELPIASYNVTGYNVKQIKGGVNSTIEGRVVFVGKNRVGGESIQIDCYHVVLTPDDAVDFASEEFQSVGISGVLNVLDGGTSAYDIYVGLENN